ncbi:TetR family transcriptional regulator [Stenotrophomonas sp. Leaf70]|uniref:TetR family transcriptional regulator n=1 Tax=Stenotrophomonas sp. Leaf70 TaxID=1736233 RepID=UPI0006FA3E64|nr:TetR family transcriptional regulator [Stenotrophomonas sp. Leaf70]KQN95830.1 TetR family transcriptional regulator [Stenotrophomonas sp. Leaf70]
MARKSKEDAQATREGILDAAVACFHEHGVVGTTLAMIAARAGYTRGAVYWHFKNKTEVLEAMIERDRMPFVQRLQRTYAPQRQTPVQDLRAVIRVSLAELAGDPRQRSLMEILLRCEQSSESQSIQSMQRQNSQEELDMVTRALERARDLGQLRAGVDAATATASRMLHISLTGALYNAMAQPEEYDLERDGLMVMDVVLQAYVREEVFQPGVFPDEADSAGWDA